MTEARILASGDTVLVLEFGDEINWRISRRVHALDRRLRHAPPEGVIETVPTFRSLAVHYDPDTISFDALGARLRALDAGPDTGEDTARLWRIPGCYDTEFAPDLAEIAERAGLSPDHVVEAHAGRAYHVYMMGFLPGFPYMGDVDETIVLPRRRSPRVRIPQGAIAVATTMTAIYTLESPGGWHILGQTPIRLFDIDRPQPALLAPGDKVVFEPVTRDRFQEIRDAVMADRYQLTPEQVTA